MQSSGSAISIRPTTQTELCALLQALGHDVTERVLIDWRAKGLLPPLERTNRARGRGAGYAWTNPDVLLQAHTLCISLARYKRTDNAVLLTWFAGFHYPESRIREIWHRLTERSWRSSLEFLTGGLLGDDDLDWVVDTLPQLIGQSSALKALMLLASLTPQFGTVARGQLEQALDEFCAQGPVAARDQLRNFIRPEHVSNVLHLYNQEFAPISWKSRIGACSDLKTIVQ